MARARNPDRDRAFDLYKEHGGNISAKQISEELNIKYRTILNWKQQDNWEERVKPEKKKRDNITKDIQHVNANPALTDKERLFCLYYIRSFNATKAYMKAFGVNYGTAATNSNRLLKNAKILEEIDSLKTARLNRELLSEDDIFQKYIDVAFADITDYVEFKTVQEPVMTSKGPLTRKDPKTKKPVPVFREYNKLLFKNSNNLDGSLIAEIKEGRQGVSIKLHDKMKALQWLSDHLNILTDEQKARIALMQSKINGDNTEEAMDDGFIDALNSTAADDWADENGDDE